MDAGTDALSFGSCGTCPETPRKTGHRSGAGHGSRMVTRAVFFVILLLPFPEIFHKMGFRKARFGYYVGDITPLER